MKVDYRHKGCTIADETKSLMSSRLEHLTQLLGEPVEAEVRLASEQFKSIDDRIACEVTVRSNGHVVRARASAAEQLHAFDLVEAKLRHQLEKLKGRLIGRSHPHHRQPKVDDGITTGEEAEEILRIKRFKVAELTPQEAAFQMEMLSHSFYLFQNVNTGLPSVVYRRADGTVGLIETEA